MGDSWEDDWEAEADRMVAGVDLHDVDESKFEGETDAPEDDDWENSVPTPQPKKVVESKYADKDRAAAAAAARAAAIDPNDKAAVQRAQADGEMAMLADMVGQAPDQSTVTLNTLSDSEKYATALIEKFCRQHTSSKQFKNFVKQVCKGLCDLLDKDGVKDIESALASIRSEKLKKEREAAKEKKGTKKSIKMESNDITAGLDNLNFSGYGDVDDDIDFM